MGLQKDSPTGENTPDNGKLTIQTLLLPEIQTWSRVPGLLSTVTKSSRDVSRKGSRENGVFPLHLRKMTPTSISPKISKRNSEKDVPKSTNDAPLPILSPKPIVQKAAASGNVKPIDSLVSQSDMNNLLEVPNDRDRRESIEVQAATSRRSSYLPTDNGESYRRQSLLSKVALDDDETHTQTVTLSGISGAGLSQDIWPEWERDISSEDVEEQFVGVIRRTSMSVVLPHVNDDTDTVDVGGIEITPGLYLRRRVKYLPEKGTGNIQETGKTTQRNNRKKTPHSISEDGPKALVPPLYPAINPFKYKRRRCSEQGINGSHRNLLEREPVPVTVSRLVPFDTSLDTPRITMDNMKSSRKYKSTKNSPFTSVEITKQDDVQDASWIPVPLSDRQPGIPFRVQDRMSSKKVSLKFKRYWNNMRNYIKAVRKLKEEVFLNSFVDVFPMKGL